MKKPTRLLAFIMGAALMLTGLSVPSAAIKLTITDSITDCNISELDTMILHIESLIDQCSAKNIPTDYESSKLTVIILYRNRIERYKQTQVYENLAYTLSCLKKLYNESIASLSGYLDGSKTPSQTARYISGSLRIDRNGIFASTESEKNDRIFLIGAGHGDIPVYELSLFSEIGFNIFQTEIGPNSVIVPLGSGDHTGLGADDKFDISVSAIENSLLPTLERARENNTAVSLLISPHYMPQFLYDIYADLRNGNTGFQKYNINHPAAKRVLECFAEVLLPYVNNYSDIILDICLANEAHYKTSLSEYDIPAWQEHLHLKYQNIDALNKQLGTCYKSFEECKMPVQNECTALKYEWAMFNNDFYTDWFAWWSGTVKSRTSLPVSIKTMGYTDDASNRILYGADIEDLAEHVDINCVDAWNLPFNNNWLYSKELAYDLARATSDLPLIDNEDHIINDIVTGLYGEQDSEYFAKHVYTDCWLGACHGRLAAVYWTWGDTFDKSNGAYGGLAQRPDAVAAMGKCSLDLSRLADEVNALSNAAPEVAVLFSDTARCYSRMNNEYVTMAYSAAQQTGRVVKPVTEDSIASLENGLTLIIPNTCNIRSDALKAVNNYALEGNKVILLGHCMTKDEYDKPSDAKTLLSIYTHSDTIGESPVSSIIYRLLQILEFFRQIISFLKGTDYVQSDLVTKNITGTLLSFPYPIMMDYTLADTLTDKLGDKDTVLRDISGKTLSFSEWRVTEYNGNILVMVCNTNIGNTLEGITLTHNGKQVTNAEDLISGEAVSASFKLEPYTPMLLSFPAE